VRSLTLTKSSSCLRKARAGTTFGEHAGGELGLGVGCIGALGCRVVGQRVAEQVCSS
jgi:hypothetical protein